MNLNRRRFLIALGSAIATTPPQGLLQQWETIGRKTNGTVGAAALHLGTGRLVTMNGDERFPLASVCKVPIAMHILALVDEKKLSLDQQIEVLPRDVWPGVSDIATRWPNQRTFRLDEMLQLMVARSDNTAVETLYRIGGGSPAIAGRLRQWKVNGVRIDRSERQCWLDRNGLEHFPPPEQWTHAELTALVDNLPPRSRYNATLRFLRDSRDTGTPGGTVALFARIFRGQFLSGASTAYLIEILKATTSFPTRLKGALPAGTIVAHKTGTTETLNGLTSATNDSGVIFLPNGSQLAVSVYIKASTRTDRERDNIIAQIARAAFDLAAE